MRRLLFFTISVALILSGCGVYYEDTGISSISDSSNDVLYECKTLFVDTNELNQFYGVVEITNTGNVNLDLTSYVELDLEDSEGHLIGNDSNHVIATPTIIKPGEVGYIAQYELCEFNGSDLTPYKLTPKIEGFNATENEPKRFEVTDVSMVGDEYDSKVLSQVINDTNEDQNVLVQCIYYDSSNTILGIYSYYGEVKANSKESFTFGTDILLNDKKDRIDHYEVTAVKDYRTW